MFAGKEAECLQEAAKRMARQCRHIVQGCLREDEWLDADEEFRTVILKGLEELLATEGLFDSR